MTTMSVLDAASNPVDIEKPLAPGRAGAASSRPVALCNEDAAFIDGLETLITSTNTKLDSVITSLSTLHSDLATTLVGYVDGLETLSGSTNTKLDTLHTDIGTTIHADVDGLETLITSTNTKLDTLHTDLGTTLHADLATTLAGILGTTAGAKVITDAAGTIQQYMRGLITQWIAGTLVLGAGSNLVGNFRIDQTSDGVSNVVVAKSAQVINTVTATIASSGTISGAIDCSAGRLARIDMPAAWTAANLTFQVSNDNSTYLDLYDNVGNEYQVTAAAGRGIIIPLTDFLGARYIKIRSGTSGSTVAQGASRVLTLNLLP